MGAEKVYQGLKKAYHTQEKGLEEAEEDPYKRVDVLSELQEPCKAIQDFCGIQAVEADGHEAREQWRDRWRRWRDKYNELEEKLQVANEGISEPPPVDVDFASSRVRTV